MPFKQVFFSLLLVTLSGHPVIAQTQSVQFNQVINLNGDMQLNSFQFPDGSKIETFSQSQKQILVNQNPSPLTANHVVGSSGQPFKQLSQNSMTISTNNATDLVGAQIEMSIPQAMLDQAGVSADNTFVAKLSPDRQAWMIMESQKSVNGTDSTVRMIKMNSLDGEYMAIGRSTTETSTVLNTFGQQSVNISGSGIQEIEYTDGFRMAVKSTMPMSITTDVVNGVSSSMITNGVMPVNNYRYAVVSNLAGVSPNLNNMMAVVQIPLNTVRLMKMAMTMGGGGNSTVSLSVQHRAVLQNPGGATGLQPQKRQKKPTSSDAPAATDTSGSAEPAIPADTTATGETNAGNSTQTEPAASESSNSASPAGDAPANAQPESNNTTGNGASNQPTPATAQNPAPAKLLLSPTFTPLSTRAVLDTSSGQSRIAIPVSQIDGEFIVTMGMGTQRAAAEGQLSAAASTSTLTISMAELNTLVESQNNGGVMPTWSMMQQMMTESQGQPAARPAIKMRSRRSNEIRGAPVFV